MKKFGVMTTLMIAALLFTMSFPASAAGPKKAAVSAVAAPAVAVASPAPEEHPRMHEAIEAMKNAKEMMQKAEGEFKGHREKAIEHLNGAIYEAEACERMK